MLKRSLMMAALAAATMFCGANTASADFIFDSTLVSNNLQGTRLNLTAVDELTPVNPIPFGADVGFATYQGISTTTNLSTLSASFDILFTDVASGMSTTFSVMVTGPVGQNSTSVSFFGGPTFMPNVFNFTLGSTTYTLDNFRSAATPGSPKTGTFAFTVNATVVPEPASMAMLAMGGLGVLGAARRRKASV